ncbi:hypothetical protein C1T31_07140 [Hanstruepera neustonica]|uniref:Uncharacterized protein n=1 Tax=Hanstruepera neustonica TaxID=1445657 RepID=A0A2K1DZ34_9FLAO|nr:hypothetical protein [Hanstruepera neustonica]PNQ73287.1 hypothetical protein C1T31_07140 [Hanstruepera neustonica]
MKIIDIPNKYNEAAYHEAINNQVNYLSKSEGVLSIYQIGGLSTPGISDIDLVVVFKDNFKFEENPRIANSAVANYLFTHGLYGASKSHFSACLKFTFFHNFRHLYGEELDLSNPTPDYLQKELKEQIALEFLFKMYINLAIQKSYNTIKLRSLFLHIKALPYDFEFLNIEPKALLEMVQEGIELRNNWFHETIPSDTVISWFKQFFISYESFLVKLFDKQKMFSPALQFKIAPNIEIQNDNALGYNRRGLIWPDFFNLLDKKYFKALNRMNQFTFQVPLNVNPPEIISSYFKYAETVDSYNKNHLPFFMTLTSSLKVYK